MALERLDESDEDFDASSVHASDAEDEDAASLDGAQAPLHPVPALQDAFEESIQEAAEGEDEAHSPAFTTREPETRRRDLLDRAAFDESWTTRWKQKPAARCHPARHQACHSPLNPCQITRTWAGVAVQQAAVVTLFS